MSLPDTQRELVYELESDYADWNRPTLKLSECRKYVSTACARYGVPPPKVRAHRRGGVSYYQADMPKGATLSAIFQVIKGSAVISFRGDGRNPAVALHEAAHAILNYWLPLGNYEDHGPQFFGVYAWLLLRADVLPEEALVASARKLGIRWMKDLTPGKFHRWRLRQQSNLKLPVSS